MKIKICSIGECMIEITNIKNTNYNYSIAGDTLNFSSYLNPKNFKVFFLTGLGTSEINKTALDFIKSKKISLELIYRVAFKEIGLYLINNDKFGEKKFYYWRDDSAAKFFFNNSINKINKNLKYFDYIYLTGITLSLIQLNKINQFIDLIHSHKKKGSKIIFDLNIREKRWSKKNLLLYLNKILPITDIIFASGEDLACWKGSNNIKIFEAVLKDFKIPHGIFRKNAILNFSIYNGKKYLIKNKFLKNVVDTSGAGDGYNAAYISNFLTTSNPLKALQKASKIGSKIVMKKGAIVDVR